MAAVSNRDVTAAMLPTDNEEIHGAGLDRFAHSSLLDVVHTKKQNTRNPRRRLSVFMAHFMQGA
jgi:hypothetical protein